MAKYLGYRPQATHGGDNAPDFKTVWNLDKYNDLLLGKDWIEDLAPFFTTPSNLGGAAEQSAFSNTVLAVDPEGRTVTYKNITALPKGLTLNTNTGVISGTFTDDISTTKTSNVTIRALGTANSYVDKVFQIKEIAAKEAAGYALLPSSGPVYKPLGWDKASITVHGEHTSEVRPALYSSHVDIESGVHDIDLISGTFGMTGGRGEPTTRYGGRYRGKDGGKGFGVGTASLGPTYLLIGAGGSRGHTGKPGHAGTNLPLQDFRYPRTPNPGTRAGGPGSGGNSTYGSGGGGGGVNHPGGNLGGGRGGYDRYDGYEGDSMENNGPVPQINIGNPKVTATWKRLGSDLTSRNGPTEPTSKPSSQWGKISWG